MEHYAGIDVSLELECLHRGCEGKDREGDKGRERSRCARCLFQEPRLSGGAGRARGEWLYAGLAWTGFFKPVHVKSLPSHAVRALLIARKKLVGQRVTLEPMSFSRKLFYTAVTIRKT